MAKVQVKPLGEQISDYLASLKLVGIDKYVPYFISSIGAHIAHLYNSGYEELSSTFWTQTGKIMDCRLHLLLVGPPGYGKNFLIDNFIEPTIGLAHGFVPSIFIGKVTDKKFFGGYNERGQWSEGVAELFRNGIVGIREFNNVLAMGRTEHSPLILENMLEALYGGDVNIGIGDHPLRNYRTYFTLWAGIQSERFAVPSGFPRRVLILNLSPSQKEIDRFADAYVEGRNIAPDFTMIQRLRDQFMVLHREVGMYIERIKFSNPYTKYLRDELKMNHIEMELVDKLSCGWTIMHTYRGEATLNIYLDKELKRLITQYLDMKHRVLYGVTQSQVLQLIDEPVPLTELKQKCVGMGIDYKKATETVDQLAAAQIIAYQQVTLVGTKRPITMVKKGINWSPSYLGEE